MRNSTVKRGMSAAGLQVASPGQADGWDGGEVLVPVTGSVAPLEEHCHES